MAKIRKGIIGALMCLFVLLIGVCALTACGSKDLTVTFSIEGREQTVDVVDGKVTFPNDPAKEYYEFRGWYTTETFDEGTEFTSDTKINESIKVYAYFAPIYVDISLNGGASEEIKLEDISTLTAEYTAEAEAEELTFDGWYIDSGYTTQYVSQDADSLYGRYVATVTFDNGYETVYSTRVQVNHTIDRPAVEDVQKFYMSADDIYYVDSEHPVTVNADGSITFNDIDFSQPITKNTTITVQWKTPWLGSYQGSFDKRVNSRSGNLVIDGVDLWADEVKEWASTTGNNTNEYWKSFPVISAPSRVTVDGEIKRVDAVNSLTPGASYLSGATCIIFQEGIESIQKVEGSADSILEKVVLPSTLKVIDTSFNKFPALTENSVSIPEGVEVILNSFWINYYSSFSSDELRTGYSFPIAVPASVKNLAAVPANLTFAEGAPFYVENNAVYKNDNGKKLLICDANVNEDGELRIAEGVEGIQVGAFQNLTTLKFLYLPSTWSYVGYNEELGNYKGYYLANNGSLTFSSLYDSSLTGADVTKLSASAYSLLSSLSAVERVAVMGREWPENVSKYCISHSKKTYEESAYKSKVVFIGTVTSGNITVYATITNRMLAETTEETFEAPVSSVLERDEALAQFGLDGANISILSTTEFGEEFEFGNQPSRNIYLDIVYEYNVTGFKAELSADGSYYVVTDYDQATAQLLSNGLYLVNIPADIGGVPVTEIAVSAFENENTLGMVFLGENVKKIGAKAFANASNLEKVEIKSRVLESIGESAFLDCAFTSIAVPLGALKEIGPYAFKSNALEKFLAVEGEENRSQYKLEQFFATSVTSGTLKEGQFYFVSDTGSVYYQIVQYVGSSTMMSASYSDQENKTVEITVRDVRLYASAGGYSGSYAFGLGVSTRGGYSYDGKTVWRYEIMTGSVYYLNNIKLSSSSGSYSGIAFGMISKIHENAFTDMNPVLTEVVATSTGGYKSSYIKYYKKSSSKTDSYEEYLNGDMLAAVAAADYDFAAADAIFEDGWWNGVKSSDENYEETMRFMAYAQATTSLGT